MYRYTLLRSLTDKDAPLFSSPNWLRSKRARITLVLLVVLIILAISIHKTDSIPPRLRQLYEQYDTDSFLPYLTKDIRWSDYAYTQYVTNENYLCNSVMMFESLHSLKSKADRVMMYPQDWAVPDDDGANSTYASKLLAQARDLYNVKLVPIKVQHFEDQEATWRDSFTKLLAFNQTQYKRVIQPDSDATILQSMDELFFLPSAPVAMPRAYWLGDKPNFLSSQLVVIEPSTFEWSRVESAINNHSDNNFDMEIVNDLYGLNCIMIPHRAYDLITGELRGKDHSKYLGSKEEKWNVTKVLEEVKFVHFSDWPYPKPWLQPSEEQTQKIQPGCFKERPEAERCSEREAWLGLYRDFGERREQICGKQFDKARRRRSIGERRPSPYEFIIE